MLEKESLDDFIGTTIKGKYLIEQFIGKGGMGSVYLAKNILLGNMWAVKIVPKNYTYAKYFRREAEILEKLNHPNMPKIIDLFEDDINIYIVETYIEGELLSDRILKNQKLSQSDTIDYFIQLTEIIEYLHSVKPYPIVYRDLKPNNIIISHNNRLVLVDFSIAKIDGLDSDDTIIAGNKYYSSPEQLNLTEKSDTRSDIYSLGMLALRMITGKLKENISIYDLDEYDEIDADLKDIIEKCIYKSQSLRYQDILELKRDLITLRDNEVKSHLKEKKIILVDGPDNCGKSFISANLAKCYASNKIKTAIFDLSSEVGLSEYLDIKMDDNINECIKYTKYDDIKRNSYKLKKNLEIYKGNLYDEKQIADFARRVLKGNDVVIIDGNLSDINYLYDASDEIVLVTSQDEKIENSTNKLIVDYVDKKIDFDNVKILVNKYENEIKTLSKILEEINIIPKIFRVPSLFKYIYKVPEVSRKNLLLMSKNKEVQIDDEELLGCMNLICNKLYPTTITKYDTRRVPREKSLIAEIKRSYMAFKTEITKQKTSKKKLTELKLENTEVIKNKAYAD